MRTHFPFGAIGLFVLLIVVVTATPSPAQDSSSLVEPLPGSSGPSPSQRSNPLQGRNPFAGPAVSMSPAARVQELFMSSPAGQPGTAVAVDLKNPNFHDARRTLDALKANLAKATGEEQRDAVTSKIRSYLTEYFDRDMKVRQAELEAVKRRVTELEKLLTARAKAKDSIINSQLETTVREAHGLGFFRR